MLRTRRTTSLSISTPKANEICCAMRGTTPARIPPFHCHDGLDEVFVGSLRARATAVPGRKQHAVLSIAQQTVEMQQSGRLQNDGGTKDTCRAHEHRAQGDYDPI